jgi:Flp pilus assembly CpaE family ATPase
LNDSYKETKNLVKILTKSDENNKKIILLLKNKNEELESNIKKLSKFIIFGFGLTLGMSVALLILN